MGMLGYGDHSRTYSFMIDEIVDALKKSREEHSEIVIEAQAAFREAAIKELEKVLAEARSGKPLRTSLGLTVPSSHLREFDTAIAVLEATRRAGTKTVDMTSDEYERFVQNNWDWTNAFRASNAPYSTKLGG